ncbi:MAG: hypothetical protein CL670_13160 [Balneola sp.]|jgi:hypothetical protein|nr:hypothetical protein [Balneola sp.]MBE80098.1 hypothetical protein [Balneola sp.]|tara:strand:+ start:282 stop:1124 length:843 start_codon:yes stop_codon:yes gene_type:complete
MKEKQLFTTGEKVEPLPESTVYLTLLIVRLKSLLNSSYPDEFKNAPQNMAYDYLEYQGSYWEVMQTCLRNFDEVKRSEFTQDYKEVALELLEEDLKKAKEELLVYVQEIKTEKDQKIEFKVTEDAKAHPLVLHELKIRDGKPKIDAHKKGNSRLVSLKKIPDSTLDNFERRLSYLAKMLLMIEAITFAERRAKLNAGKYKFKKLMNSLSEVYDDYIINKSSNKPKKSLLQKKNADLIKYVTNNYEIIGNTTYLLNKRKFEKAVRGHFVPKLKKARKDLAK